MLANFPLTGKPLAGFPSTVRNVRLIVTQAETLSIFFARRVLSLLTLSSLLALRRAVEWHRIVLSVQDLSLLSTGRKAVALQAQLVTLRRSASKLLATSTAEAVTLRRSASKRLVLTLAQTTTLARITSRLRLVSVSAAQSLVLTRAMSRRTSLSQSQSVSLRRRSAHLVSLLSSNAAVVRRRTGHRFSLTLSQVLVLQLRLTGPIMSVHQGLVVVLRKVIGKLVLKPTYASIFQMLASLPLDSVLQTPTGGSTIPRLTQITGVRRAVSRRVSVSSLSQVVRLLRAGRLTLLAVPLTQVASLARTAGKHVTAPLSQALSLVRDTWHRVVTTSAQAVTLRRRASTLLTVLTSQLATVRRQTRHRVTFAQSNVAALLRQTGHRVILSQGYLLRLPRQVTKVVRVTQSLVAMMRRAVSRTITLVTVEDVQSVAALSRTVRALGLSQVIVLRRATQHYVSKVLSPQVTRVIKEARHRVLLTSSIHVLIIFGFHKVFKMTQGQALRLARVIQHSILMTLSQVIAVVLNELISLRATRMAVGLPRVRRIVARTRAWVGKFSSSFDNGPDRSP